MEIDGDQVIWIDHENRRTPFPLPNHERPAIHNSLSRAAIYLGDEPEELILAQAGDELRFYHFHNGRLTAISDAYDNRLRVSRDRQQRIQRLDNGAGRALLLRYDRAHLIAVDYQRFVPAQTLAEATWHTEQTLVSYRYDECDQLIEASNAAGESERYDYDDRHVIFAAATGRWREFLLGVGTVRQGGALRPALGVVCADGCVLRLGRPGQRHGS